MHSDVKLAWEEIHGKIVKIFGKSAPKLSLAELICLRQFAASALRATMLRPEKKSRSRRKITR